MPEDEFHVVDDLPADDAADDADAPSRGETELDGLRIRKIAAERRAIYRQRSYCVIAAAACAVGGAQLIWFAAAEARPTGWNARATVLAVGAVLALIGGAYIARLALKLHRQTKGPTIAEPTGEPDFSTLSDGSQRWKNLHDV